jgi:hypothetical protein
MSINRFMSDSFSSLPAESQILEMIEWVEKAETSVAHRLVCMHRLLERLEPGSACYDSLYSRYILLEGADGPTQEKPMSPRQMAFWARESGR